MSESGVDRAVSEPVTAALPSIRVPTHGLTRYLRVRLGVDRGVMWWDTPRTFLGVVPVGMKRIEVPLGEVLSLSVGRRVRPLNLAAGLACIALPIVFVPWWVAVPVAVVGLWVTLVALGPSLDAVASGGRSVHADVCLGHEIDAELYITAVVDLAAQSRRS